MVQVPRYTELSRYLCAPGTPLAGARQIAWGALADQPLCLLTGDMQNRRIVNQHLAEAGVQAQAQIESNSTVGLVAHVLTGKWGSVVPMALAQMFAGSGLISVPIVEPEVEHQVGLIAPRHDPQTPLIAALLEAAARAA